MEKSEMINTNKISNSFPTEVFKILPDFLRTCCDRFDSPIEQAVFLVGSLGVLSGCNRNVIGIYDGRQVGSNLFVFIQAHASAGKGYLIYATYLARAIHQKKRQQSKDEQNEYQDVLFEYNKARKKSKGAVAGPPPEPPKQKMLFVPVNTSSSAFIEALGNNEGNGIMFSTEADTLNEALKQDWGNYSSSMRSAFHHEPITLLRRSNKEFLEVDKPFLSVILSGTPIQLKTLIPNVENGLFSRFCFYNLTINHSWKNVFTKTETDFEEYFTNKGYKLLNLYERLECRTEPVIFKFTTDQEQLFNEKFNVWQQDLIEIYGNEVVASVRRLGLINFRIAMLLSVLRLIDEPSLPNELICTHTDFRAAEMLTETFKNNAIEILKGIPNTNLNELDSENKVKFYKALPDEFTREQAVSLAGNYCMSAATIDRLLKSTKLFIKLVYGNYKKTER